ncbi:MAG: STAS domain-containing protein [Sediminibacterium sp.]|jgi:anti-anti-sigma factor|nr:STAS domain-containing protein [Sediminibacterium sp.]
MSVKISTKEKFSVVQPDMAVLSDNLTDDLINTCLSCLDKVPKNVVLNLESISSLSDTSATRIMELQQKFYENNASFVICCVQEAVEEQLDKMELLEIMNTTPTESEAWDIVQMEEIERELLDSDDVEFEQNN